MRRYEVTVEVITSEVFVIDADDATMAAYQAELQASGPWVSSVRSTNIEELEYSKW